MFGGGVGVYDMCELPVVLVPTLVFVSITNKVIAYSVNFLLQEKETKNGGNASKVLSLDDYFMNEVEKVEKDPDTGKQVKKSVSHEIYYKTSC